MPFRTRARPRPCSETPHPRRLIALLLLLGGLLLSALACSVSTGGHADTVHPPVVSAARDAPVAAAPQSHGPHSASHSAAHCAPATEGRSPQSRSSAEAAVPALLGAAVPAAAVLPAVRGASPQRRPAPTGRSTLVALCWCRR